MITSYIIVLATSAWLVTFLLLYVAKRFGKLFGNPALISPGFIILLPLLGFLTVVAAPPPMLVACVLLLGAHLTRRDGHLPPIARFGVPMVAALLTGSHLVMPDITGVPPVALQVLSTVLIFGFTVGAEWLPTRAKPASIGILTISLPLIASPFLGAPSFIAVDVVLIASVLLAAAMIMKPDASFTLARTPIGLVLGWLIITAAANGAWITAIVSTLVYGAVIATTLARTGTELTPHAS